MTLELRPYQIEAIEKTLTAAERGVRRQLGVAATGTGKTCVFVNLAKRMGCRTVILAHRDELVTQAVDKIRQWWPEAEVGVVKADSDDVGSHVVVASVQTLSRPRRLQRLVDSQHSRLWGHQPIGLLVTDEAHHSTSASYQAVYAGLGIGSPDGPLHLGVTATPDRGDGKGLDGVFDEITWSYDIEWGIRSGYLCDVRGQRITMQALDLSAVKVRRGDYAEGDLGRAMEDAGAPDAVARAYCEHAKGRRAVVFTPTVALAEHTATALVAKGVRAGWASGETPAEDRRATLRAFSAGELDVIVNCMLWTEGWDEPRADCAIIARPTRSRALYAQMAGRVLRRHPDKTDALIIDVVGVTEALSLVALPSLFGVDDAKQRARLSDGSAAITDLLDERDALAVAAGKLTAEEADLFHRMRQTAGIAWVPVHVHGDILRRYERSIGRPAEAMGEAVVVLAQRQAGDVWTAGVWWPKENRKLALIRDVTMELAQGVAEDYARKHGRSLARADSEWRKRKPTTPQRDLCKRMRIAIQPDWTAGDVSDAIDQRRARRRLKASR